MTPSVLQAKAEALLLAARIASTFQLQDITFLTDNSTLSKARSVSHSQVPWEIRNHIAGYINLTQSLGASVYHIKRDLNGVVHDSAH
jgi:predicted SPOUT superfamily RNA methylase MTH1